jgi:ATP-binding cassette subfamily F protein 3
MLLRPANTLLLDEPTNHLDLDSKDVLLEALEDFGGTLIFVSHDRYFVDRLATKVIAVGHGAVEIYPGTYEQFLWSRTHRPEAPAASPKRQETREATPGLKTRGSKDTQGSGKPATPGPKTVGPVRPTPPPPEQPAVDRYQEKKKADADTRRRQRQDDERRKRVADLEARITERELAIKALEAQMATPGFYEERATAEAIASKHHQLMWEVGDLMNQWEALQEPKTAS